MIPPDPTINLEVKMAQALGELQFRLVVLAAQTEHLSRQLAEVQAENTELKKKPGKAGA